ncbi:glutamate-1-semialdehyde 2,1-aminomutase [Acidiferrimicrobium sp. IK]|uniref:glutamate-1-semialdehyde 2,1-aminomutase n=1 Tax=Acidiferrimicrobium sp. IK TaxID=2871700 RepID=UPI0021CAFAD8|nr:glutamate-1-semialdehyde 2,1-aminomutase [Acidiferrimicrobium sp. IK]MCU4183159.1 glutamate-1-semialdehyde 2,1-aminomutase [Acidiferrimicrobium sp. IK]
MAEPPITNDALFARAQRVAPGGVNSPVRAFRSVGGTPYFVARGFGSKVWDVEGNEYLDYVQSYGASILGHAHPAVVAAVQAAAGDGSTFGAPTEREVLLAEEIAARVPGAEMVRLVNSGTEATMSAVRLARGATGRDRVVVFDGCYHGHSDGLLAGGGSGVATLGIPASAGVPAAAVSSTLVVPYNQVPALSDDVACVVVEPIAANMGLVPPAPGFLEGLRAECDRVGALLVFDEVITGFRVARGGAAQVFGVQPDLWCFGKVIGGGLPLAAFAGRRDLMTQLAPLGPIYQAGTLSGNPLATAAGLAVLGLLDDTAYAELATIAGKLAAGIAAACHDAGLQVQVPVAGPLLGVFFAASPVEDYEASKASAATGHYPGFMHGLLERGIAVAPGAYEVLFPSLAHSDADLARTVEAVGDVAAGLAAG